ncbi:MAG: lactate utilization protein [Clostridia bacterium]|nr:lactate utilization protein [Clostridia bacterium]
MDKHLQSVLDIRIRKTLDSLKKNKMQGHYVATRDEAVAKVSELLNDGDTVAVGGSMTLFEAGVIDHLRSGRYTFFDRYAEGLSGDQIQEIFRKAFVADAFVTSTNAITENGELYNVDGMGNRVAAMVFGPKNVIVVAGINKIVKDVEAAVARVEQIAAPANATRIHCDTPCTKTGSCMHCRSDNRICCSYTVFGQQRIKDRIKVILVGESLGY